MTTETIERKLEVYRAHRKPLITIPTDDLARLLRIERAVWAYAAAYGSGDSRCERQALWAALNNGGEDGR